MEKPYHIVERKDTQGLASFLAKNGQALLPMLEWIEQSQAAVDELIDVVGRATIEAVLRLSAERVAGPPHPGKKGGAIGWHGGEPGTICLKERKLRVKRPRLRKKGEKEGGEVAVPAYEALRADGKLGSRMLEILLRGVSTRQYKQVLPEMAETVGVTRSSVSREAIEASEAELKRLCERRLDDLVLLVLYLDGVIFGEHHVLVALGVDVEGRKHVLGLAVFGTENPVQRCRQHKLENVTGYLPEELKDQVKAAMRAGFRLPAKEGMAKLEKQAQWLEHEYPSAAASLREGLAEMFTVNRLELSPRLARCLCSTNVIESPHSGVRRRTRRVCRWRDGKMVLRWAAAALLMTESNFRRIMGYRDLWMLAAALGRKTASAQEKVA